MTLGQIMARCHVGYMTSAEPIIIRIYGTIWCHQWVYVEVIFGTDFHADVVISRTSEGLRIM